MSDRTELGKGARIVTPTYDERCNQPRFVRATLEVAPRTHTLVVEHIKMVWKLRLAAARGQL